jgi:hypothetical protein
MPQRFLAKCGPPPFDAGVEFRVGDRIKISDIGSQRYPRLAHKTSTVTSAPFTGNSITVRFDGNKLKTSLHRAYSEPIARSAEC